MKTLKRTIQLPKTQEVEVKIPSYFHDSPHTYKIISYDKAIQVYDNSYGEDCSIQTVHIGNVFCVTPNPTEIDEATFNSHLKIVQDKIHNLINSTKDE